VTLSESKVRWSLINDAYSSSGGFQTGDNIVKFPREHEDKYKARKSLALYVNKLKPACSRYASYLFKRKATRTSNSALISLIFDNADRMGNAIDIFMKSFYEQVRARGTGIILVDMPTDLGASLLDQTQKRLVPYFIDIDPSSIFDFKIGENGNFEWVILEYHIEEKEPFKLATLETQYHLYSATVFEKYDKDYNLISSREHSLGECPVVSFTEQGVFPCVSSWESAATISKRLYNAQSELDEILRGQTFSLLIYHIPDGQDIDNLGIGINNVLKYPADAPSFISPPSAPADTYMQMIEKLESLIDDVTLNPDNASSKTQETGVALQFKFETLNSSLSSNARGLEDFERVLFAIAFKWLGENYDYEVGYPKDFSIADLKTEIENTSAMVALNMGGAYESAKKKELARLDLVGADYAVIEEISKELDSANSNRPI
jgi:hypothetical protein